MQTTFDVPHFAKITWHHEDVTYIIGPNGVGKTLLLNEMMDYCDRNGINYNHYDAITALRHADFLINDSDDMDIILSCRFMAELSYDFAEDVKRWASVMGYPDGKGDYMEDPKVLRHVLSVCGNGYTRMFIMTVLAMRNPSAGYYFMDLPETSLHIMLMRKIADYLMAHFQHMKFVFATHSPEMLASLPGVWDGENKTKLINLPEDYFTDEVLDTNAQVS